MRFEKANGPDLSGAAKYQFLASTLEFGRVKPPDPAPGAAPAAAPAKPPENSIAMTVRPIPDPSAVYYLTGTDWSQAWGVSTALSSAYSKSNPLILESIGTETTDKRKDLIASVGGLLVAAAPLIVFNRPLDGSVVQRRGSKKIDIDIPPDLPVVKILPDTKTTSGANVVTPMTNCNVIATNRDLFVGGSFAGTTTCDVWLNDDNTWQIGDSLQAPARVISGRIEFGPVRESASSRVSFDAVASRDSSVMYYSACRTVTLTIDSALDKSLVPPVLTPVEPVVMTALIADPNWIETAKLLYKGTISLLTPCGITVGEEKGAAPNPLDGGTEFLKQFKAVRDAHKPPAK
ncbi:MAG: hypothetical protein IBJ15_04725 [Alphaproteobacteria bacterium]|nr:hypothetical protein [Alphaproteobacteria bacterium]